MSRVGTPFANASLRTPICVSCDEGADCQYVSARFSDTGRFYVLACLGPGVPRYTLVNQSTATREYCVLVTHYNTMTFTISKITTTL